MGRHFLSNSKVIDAWLSSMNTGSPGARFTDVRELLFSYRNKGSRLHRQVTYATNREGVQYTEGAYACVVKRRMRCLVCCSRHLQVELDYS